MVRIGRLLSPEEAMVRFADLNCPSCARTIWLCVERGARIYMRCVGCEQIMLLPVRDAVEQGTQFETAPTSLSELISALKTVR
jgi:hypothetical protein